MGRCGVMCHGTHIMLQNVQVANSFWTRFMGLMGRAQLGASEGLLLMKTNSIHTCFMRFPIDVIYLDQDYTVLHVQTVAPWRMGALVKGTKHVLELAEGAAKDVIQGERLSFQDIPTKSIQRSDEYDRKS